MYYQVTRDVSMVQQVVHALYQLKINSVLVEGGARLLQSFIDEGIWDEARIITNPVLRVSNGLPSPVLSNEVFANDLLLGTDQIHYYTNSSPNN